MMENLCRDRSRGACRVLLVGLGLFLVQSCGIAQRAPEDRPRARPASDLTGWADWERAREIFSTVPVPPSPPLGPEEAMKGFRVAPGFRLDRVAAEPMIANPIFFEFDPDGRLWAIEYRGYMRNLAGDGEGDPICRVVVLEDFNGDGKADRSTAFLDKLVMPRSLAFVKGGVLVAEPPRLWFCQDTNADLRCDIKTEVGAYGRPGNPQHTANGLAYGIDNWLHSADWPTRHRFENGRLIEEPVLYRGQFGVSFDEFGRYVTCRENVAAQMDLIPEPYLRRNPALLRSIQKGPGRGGHGAAVAVADDASECFPIRPTPGVTLGGLELRDDGTLRTYTIVSGTGVYLGDQFPPDAYGNIFVPEAGGHLIGRLRLNSGIDRKAARFYPAHEEILRSTDERFRPMNIRTGPDGALWFADMYQGIIEHVIFMVPYLADQIRERGLDRGTDMGRIYRLVSTNQPVRTARPNLGTATSARLARHLGHPNGWWRMTAQRLLVERRDETVLPRLRQMAISGTNPIARMHALWTLDGMGRLTPDDAGAAAEGGATRTEHEAMARATALRLLESSLQRHHPGDAQALKGWIRLLGQNASDPSDLVRLQVLLGASATAGAECEALTLRLLTDNEGPLYRTAAWTGLAGREVAFVRQLMDQPAWREPSPHRRSFLRDALFLVSDSEAPVSLAAVLELIASQQGAVAWRREVMLEALIAAAPGDSSRSRPISIPSEPRIIQQLLRSNDKARRDQAWRLREMFTWPGAESGRWMPDQGAPLSEAEETLFTRGRETFQAICAPCHQPHGGGLSNVAPPLNRSARVNGSTDPLIRIVLHGLYGPLEVNNVSWNHHMPGFGDTILSGDEPAAAVLTYVRRSWDNRSAAVPISDVARVRAATRGRIIAWTAHELLASNGQASARDNRTPPPAPSIRPDASGSIALTARLASCHGEQLAYRPSLDIMGPWRKENDVATWQVDVPVAGRFEVRVMMAADQTSAGDRFVIEAETERLHGKVVSTGGYSRFTEVSVGSLSLRAGDQRILMRPEGSLRGELADVRGVTLIPLKPR